MVENSISEQFKKFENITQEEFLKLDIKEISDYIQWTGKPESAMVVCDGSRRYLLIENGFLGQDLANNYLELYQTLFVNIMKLIFSYGIKTLFVPGLSKGNFQRGNKYIDTMINIGIKDFCLGKTYLNFFSKYGVNVKVFGDIDYIICQGYPDIGSWVAELHEKTSKNNKHQLFIGFGDGTIEEEEHLVKLGINFFNKYHKTPTRADLINLYYGAYLTPIDIFIRPCECRESNTLPVLLGGRAEMYFPVVTASHLDDKIIRLILYDYLFKRIHSSGGKKYDSKIDSIKFMKEYYEKNKYKILGLGDRTSDNMFWYPTF